MVKSNSVYETNGINGSWYVVATPTNGNRYIVDAAWTKREALLLAKQLRRQWPGGPVLTVELDLCRARGDARRLAGRKP